MGKYIFKVTVFRVKPIYLDLHLHAYAVGLRVNPGVNLRVNLAVRLRVHPNLLVNDLRGRPEPRVPTQQPTASHSLQVSTGSQG